jgi:hypothetical protein
MFNPNHIPIPHKLNCLRFLHRDSPGLYEFVNTLGTKDATCMITSSGCYMMARKVIPAESPSPLHVSPMVPHPTF